MRKYFSILGVSLLVIGSTFFSCTKPLDPVDPGQTDTSKVDTIPVVPVDSNYIAPGDTVREKPVVMWIDANANSQRLATKARVKNVLNKAREHGINGIVVGVKPGQGTALYESEFLKPCTTLNGEYISRDWDYLEYILTTAKELGMRVEASASVMVMGEEGAHNGAIYDDPYFQEIECVEYLPTGLHKITEGSTFPAINPAHPKTLDYIKRMITEIFSNPKYAALDGFCLDYCRYMNANSDFSDYSRDRFVEWLAENYPAQSLVNWPTDIYYYKEGETAADQYTPGPLYNYWLEWRALMVKRCVEAARDALKAVRPDADLSVWAAAWYPLPATGQNWGSTKYKMVDYQWWATPNYHNSGYADLLDYFQLGAYYDNVLGYNAGTIQYAINYCNTIMQGDCPFWGTFSVASAKFDATAATEYCLLNTEGCMVFDLCHIAAFNHWDRIKAGVDSAWEQLGVNSPLKVKQVAR